MKNKEESAVARLRAADMMAEWMSWKAAQKVDVNDVTPTTRRTRVDVVAIMMEKLKREKVNGSDE